MNGGRSSRKRMENDLLSGMLLQSPYLATSRMLFHSTVLALLLFTPKKPIMRSLNETSRRELGLLVPHLRNNRITNQPYTCALLRIKLSIVE